MHRIVTLTLNPAIDVACAADAVLPSHKIRTTGETHDLGGGGINVSRVLHELGAETMAVALTGGAIGQQLLALLAASGVPARGVDIDGTTRICATVHDRSSGQEYRFVPEGPLINATDLARVTKAVLAENPDWLVLSGSLPRGAPPETYAVIARHAGRKGTRIVLDTSGAPLAAAIGQGLTLIKPSLRELEGLVGHPLPDAASQDGAVRDLLARRAATYIAVSLGAEGALLASDAGILRRPAIPVAARGAVGAGDSFCAALTLSLARGDSDEVALDWALAAGAASVMATGTAHPTRAAIEALRSR